LHNTQLNGKGNVTQMGTEPYTGAPIETFEDQYYLHTGDLLRVVWRRLWVIALVAIIVTGAAVGFSLLQTPQYEASIKVLIGQKQKFSKSSGNLGQDIQGLQLLTQTMAEVAHTRSVATAVIEDLDLQTSPEGFLRNMSVEQAAETQVIEISYEDPSPEKAQLVANTIGNVFSEQVSEFSPQANAVSATVVEPAALPENPVSPQPIRNGLLALMTGIMLGLILAFLLEYRDDSWRSPEEAEQVSGVPTFGIIPEFERVKSKTKTK
jgi:capsular polysaccharide biosynthesis protein